MKSKRLKIRTNSTDNHCNKKWMLDTKLRLFNIVFAICSFIFVSEPLRADLQITLNNKINLEESEPFQFSIEAKHQSLLKIENINATLGDYDISAMLVSDGESLYFHNYGAVPPGSYVTTIKNVSQDNRITVLFNQRLIFYRDSWQTSSKLTVKGSYQLDSEGNDAFIKKIKRLSESALSLQAVKLGKNSHVTTKIDLQHRSDRNTISGDKLEIPHFYVGVEKPTDLGKLGFALGNQSIGQNGLVFNGFNRRGLSAKLSNEQGRYALNAFVTNTDPEISSKNKVPLATNKKERSSGVTVHFQPFETSESTISILGGYLDGRSQLQGVGIGLNSDLLGDEIEPLSYGGKTWFMATNADWFEKSLNLQMEKAQSNIDSDGFGFGEPAKSDHASRYRIALNSRGKFKGWLKLIDPLFWELSVQQQTVGADFFSMANIGLAGDVQSQQNSFQLSWSELQLLMNHVKIQNDIDKHELIPTQTSRQNQVQLNFRPEISIDNKLWKTIGQPTFALQLSNTQRNQHLNDAHLLGADINDQTQESKFSASFQRENLNWTVQHTLNQYKNRALDITPEGESLSAPRSSNNNRFTALSLNYNFSSNLSFAPSLQRSKYKETNTGNWQTSLNLSFQTNMSFLENTLNLYLNYNSSEQDNYLAESLLSQFNQSKQSTMTISWLAKKAENKSPGLMVSFNTIWNDRKASYQDAFDSYQLHLTVEVLWASGVE